MTDKKICIKCQGEMHIGNFIGTISNSEKEKGLAFIKQDNKKITTYACEDCGFLESYVKK